ncbi:hypothetical protein J1N35_015366 [Gossypium stocksii]|uniref:DUF4283 domain-containing protein n=1 Tax=Gossypium stocksii TaxID=47602 RepID=A0A9D3VWT4_9ROSI|nr:hypothetical protein J1N35_015366 [Gossypium stocksii]
MVVNDEPKSTLSWKDRLLGNLAGGPRSVLKYADEIELMDKDITRSVVSAIPTINFSGRVNQLLIKDMATTVVLELLGQSVGYNYFTVQPRTTDFNLMLPYPSVVKAWIKLPGLPDSRMRGKFVGMVVYIYLDKPLTSQVLINGQLQRVEFESLPVVCFGCG